MELKIYSASGKFLTEVYSFNRVKTYTDSHQNEVFDDGNKRARVESGMFLKFFDRDIQPQDIRKAWNEYNNYPTSDR
jgi:hypothetical protein